MKRVIIATILGDLIIIADVYFIPQNDPLAIYLAPIMGGLLSFAIVMLTLIPLRWLIKKHFPMIKTQAIAAISPGILSLLYYAFVDTPLYIPFAIAWSVFAVTLVVSLYLPL